MDPLHRNLAIWAQAAKILRADYIGLREVLQGPYKVDLIRTLPKKLDTLKKSLNGQVEKIKLLRRKISVISLKLPTLSSADRALLVSTKRYI